MVYVMLLAAFAFVLLVFAAAGIKIIRPYQRGLVERLGRYHSTVDPGLRLIVPVIDRMVRVDMRESVVEVPAPGVITSDNVAGSVCAVAFDAATPARPRLTNAPHLT